MAQTGGPVSAHYRRREQRAVESFQTAAACIGPVMPGMGIFAVTRGQFGAVDVVNHLLTEIGPAHVSLWTWCIANYELEVMAGLLQRGDILSGRLVIDQSSDKRNPEFIEAWRERFGADAVKITRTHAKLYRVWTPDGRYRLLCRGSFNLNYSPRLEQLDIDEGSPAFDLVAGIEDDLPVLPRNYTSADVMAAGKLDRAYPPEVLAQFVQPGAGAFQGLRTWQKI
jgi:hypothetical protein